MATRAFRFLRDMLDLDETSKTAGKVVAVNDDADGYELVDAAAASGGAPTTATYIVQTADATLSAEQALADLATGIVKNTTTTGVLSIAAEGTDYYGPSGTDVALADGGTGASLADPGADRIMFWDDSGSTVGFLQTGSGLSLSGTVLTSPGPAAGDGLALTGTVFSVNVDDSTLEINTDTLRVKDGGITAAKVAADVATQAELDAHINDAADAHDASAISIADAANDFTATDVEGALAELQADHETDAQNLSDHIADAAGAHAATAISFTPTGGLAADDVAEALAELDSEKTTAAAALSAAQAEIADQKRVVEILVSDPNGDAIMTGDGKAYFRVPSVMNGHNLVSVAASVSTASSSGIPTVQIRNATQTADMLTTKLTIDEGELDSKDATAAAVIDTSNDDVATGDQIHIDIDVAGTGAKGLLVSMTFEAP